MIKSIKQTPDQVSIYMQPVIFMEKNHLQSDKIRITHNAISFYGNAGMVWQKMRLGFFMDGRQLLSFSSGGDREVAG